MVARFLTAFYYILFLFLWTVGFTQSKDSNQSTHQTIAKTGKDTLNLYFPLKEFGKDSVDNVNALDTFTNVWYSRMLFAMNEPILASYEGDAEIYRFTWLRTFHRPLAIRIQKISDNVTLTTKVLSGAGGYDPGQIITHKTIRITEEEWNETQSKFRQMKFWELPVETDFRGFDGAEWILESSTKEKYHFTTRWSPGKDGIYRKCCLYLLKLSGIKIPDRDIY